MKRVYYFLLTNFAIIIILSITLRVLGIDSLLAENGSDLDLNALLIFACIFGFGGAFISLAISKWMAKRISGAEVIKIAKDDQEKWLLETVAKQAKIIGINMPEVAIFPSNDMNAFATGASKNNALVALSRGLLEQMNRSEIEAVLGHEMSHVANGDMVTLTLIQGIINTFVIFFARIIGHFVDRVLLKNKQGYGIGYFITTIIAEIILAVLASLIVMYFSRRREFVADTGGADLAGTEAMISALRKLGAKEPSALPGQLTGFGIGEKTKLGFMRLWSSHPSIEIRIYELEMRAARSQ